MDGAAKGECERTIALAHQVAVFSRKKTIKPLSHYLKPPPGKKAGGDERALVAMARRLQKRKD